MCSDDFQHKIYSVRRSDPDNSEEASLIRGKAEPIDEVVRHRCDKLSLHFDHHLTNIKKNIATTKIPARVPRTPSNKPIGNYSTPSRQPHPTLGTPVHGPTLYSPIRSAPRTPMLAGLDSPLAGKYYLLSICY